MKKFLAFTSLGILLGAGGLCGIAQIPNVRDMILKTDSNSTTSIDSEEVDKLKDDNFNLSTQVDSLNSELKLAQEQIVQKDNLIKMKNDEISILNSEKMDLQNRLSTALKEKEQLESLVGSDTSQLISSISTLTAQLEEKTNELNTANIELEQLRADKTSLTTRVSELETLLNQVQEELANYKSLDDIEVLNIANFEGKWYLNGTFEDLIIIKDGVVTHNGDTGIIQCLNNQVYLFMSNSSEPVNLSVDGNSFSTSDGSTYSKFYINTSTSCLPNYGEFCGSYSYDRNTITLNSDNTLNVNDGVNTYYGSYIVTSIEKNIGGNIKIINSISATINVGDVQETKEYEVVSNSNQLIDISTSDCYQKTDSAPILLAESNYSIPTSGYYVKAVIRTDKPIILKPGSTYPLYLSVYGPSAGSYDIGYINGTHLGSATKPYVSKNISYIYNGDSVISATDFVFYISMYSNSAYVDFINSFDGVGVTLIEKVYLSNQTYALNRMNVSESSLNSNSTIECVPIDDYINGNYSMDSTSISISSNDVSISSSDETLNPTIKSYDVTARTDGYDIYQTATIVYTETQLVDGVETQVDKTIVINYKNNNIVNATLDGVEQTIVKN